MCSGLLCVPHQLFLQTFLPEAVLNTDGEVRAIPMPWNIWIDNQYFMICLFGLFRQQMNPSLRVTSLDPSYTTRHEPHCREHCQRRQPKVLLVTVLACLAILFVISFLVCIWWNTGNCHSFNDVWEYRYLMSCNLMFATYMLCILTNRVIWPH